MFQAGIAVILLWLNKKRKYTDNLLITLIACIGVHLFAKWVIYAMVSDKDVQLAMNTFIQLAYGPLVYLYSQELRKKKHLSLVHLLLFVPMLLTAIAYFSVISLLVVEPQTGHYVLRIYNDWTTHLIVFGNGIYAALSLRLMTGQKAVIVKADYTLARQISFIFLMLSMLSIAYMIKGGDQQQLFILRYIAYSLLMTICFLVVRHKYVSANDQEDSTRREIEDKKDNLYERKPLLLDEQLDNFATIINQYMFDSKAYRDIEFNMDRMSIETRISRRYISETLNKHFSKTFYQYVNEYRLKDFIRELDQQVKEGTNVNMLNTAYRCGFKNKSSFNLHFKKITGLTPSAYMRSRRQAALIK